MNQAKRKIRAKAKAKANSLKREKTRIDKTGKRVLKQEVMMTEALKDFIGTQES